MAPKYAFLAFTFMTNIPQEFTIRFINVENISNDECGVAFRERYDIKSLQETRNELQQLLTPENIAIGVFIKYYA